LPFTLPSWRQATYWIFEYKDANNTINKIKKLFEKIDGEKVWKSKV